MNVNLKYPVNHDGKTITSVTFHRARGKDMRVLAKHSEALMKMGSSGEGRVTLSEGETDAILDLIASLTDTPVSAVNEFDSDDIVMLMEKLSDFFPQPGRVPATPGEL